MNPHAIEHADARAAEHKTAILTVGMETALYQPLVVPNILDLRLNFRLSFHAAMVLITIGVTTDASNGHFHGGAVRAAPRGRWRRR